MSHMVQVFIDDDDVIGCVLDEPSMLAQIIKGLRRRETRGSPAAIVYDEVARLLGQDVDDADGPTPAWLAQQVAALDTIGKREFAMEATRLILPEHLTVEAT